MATKVFLNGGERAPVRPARERLSRSGRDTATETETGRCSWNRQWFWKQRNKTGGTVLAQSLTEAGLIDEYRLYLRPVVLGGGKPFFAGPRPPLHLAASDLIADDLIRLTYIPA